MEFNTTIKNHLIFLVQIFQCSRPSLVPVAPGSEEAGGRNIKPGPDRPCLVQTATFPRSPANQRPAWGRGDQWEDRDRPTLVTISSPLHSSHLGQSSDISEHFLGRAGPEAAQSVKIQTSDISQTEAVRLHQGPSLTRQWAAVVAKTPVTSDSCLLRRRVINSVTELWWAQCEVNRQLWQHGWSVLWWLDTWERPTEEWRGGTWKYSQGQLSDSSRSSSVKEFKNTGKLFCQNVGNRPRESVSWIGEAGERSCLSVPRLSEYLSVSDG